MIVHQRRSGSATLATEMARWLADAGHEVGSRPTMSRHRPDLAEWSAGADGLAGLDLAVSIGGDGTMLRAVHAVVAAGVPVMGSTSATWAT